MRRAVLLIPLATMLAGGEADGPTPQWGAAPGRVAAIGLTGLGVVAAYGFAAWDWGESSFAVRSEGWFGADTPYGGADKLGHAYTASAITAGASGVARGAGAGTWESALLGGATATLWTTAIEIGDGFSPAYGASPEDQVFNLLGAGFEVLRQGSPWLAERVQFRWEWLPSPLMLDGTTTDPFSDYSGSRYLLAFPAAPWLPARHPLRFIELVAGYGTTGFDDPERIHYQDEERSPFIGVGFSIAAGLDAIGAPLPWRLLEHVQVPYTAWPAPDRP